MGFLLAETERDLREALAAANHSDDPSMVALAKATLAPATEIAAIRATSADVGLEPESQRAINEAKGSTFAASVISRVNAAISRELAALRNSSMLLPDVDQNILAVKAFLQHAPNTTIMIGEMQSILATQIFGS